MNYPSFQQFLSLLLACSMALSLAVVPVQAEELSPDTSAETGEVLTETTPEDLSETEAEPEDDADTEVEEAPLPEVEPEAEPMLPDLPAEPENEEPEAAEPEIEEEPAEPALPEEETAEAPETDWVTARSADDVVRFLQENWSEDYIREIEVDTRKNTIRVDGSAADLVEVFGEDAADSGLLDSVKEAEKYLEETPFEPVSSSKGVLTVTAPYQSCRIVVNAAELSDGYGAVTVLEMPDHGQYILQFADEAATAKAYETLHGIYGDDCFVDEIIWSDEVLTAVHEDLEYPLSTENGTIYSWGNACIGTADRKYSGNYVKKSATVAIIDTGIDPDNWFFEGRTISNASWDTTTGLKGRSNLIDYAGTTTSTGHGTHVAGIITDCTPDTVELLVIRIFNDIGESSWSMVNSAILYAIEEGADIVNLSLGQQSASLAEIDPISEALTSARSAGVPVVCAAGNNSVNVANMYPASHPLTIAVSSIASNHNFSSAFSNFGADIDFCAPGSSITSALRGGEDGATSTKSGTSMAAPHLTAAMTYLIMDNPTAGVQALYDMLKDNCLDLGAEGKDNYFGWGCPVLPANTHVHTWSEEAELSDGEYRYSCVSCKETLTLPVSCGSTVTWSLSKGVLTVSGSGKMADYDKEAAPWSCFADRITTVIIKNGVTSVGKSAFRGLPSLQTLQLPQKSSGGTLTSIGEFAFFGCPFLRNPTLPATLTALGDGAFAACDSITRYAVEAGSTVFQASSLGFLWSRDGKSTLYACPTGYSSNGKNFSYSLDVQTIRPYAFYHCRALSKIVLRENVKNIGEEAFGGCAALGTIYFIGNRPTFADHTFDGVIADAAWSSAATGWSGTLPQLGGTLAWQSYRPNLSDCLLNMEEEFIYTGKSIKPAFTLTSNGIRLDSTDYTAVYTDNVEPGTATLTLTGRSAYTGTLVKNFRIVKPLTGLSLTVADGYYTGEPVTPEILLMDGENLLTEGVDYTAVFTDNVEPGTATLTLTGMGLYTGTLTAEFTVFRQKDLKELICTAADVTYTGKAVLPKLTLTDGEYALQSGTDYTIVCKNNTKVGTASYTITGQGKYTGTLTGTYKVKAYSAAKLTVTLSANSFTYTGKAIKPGVTVKHGSKKLVSGTDYTFTYANNTKVGLGTITLKCKGNYTGTVKVTFSIVPKATSVSSASSKKTGQLTIKWKKNTTATGYQVQAATDKAFTKNLKKKTVSKYSTVSCTLTGLKKKTNYYIRIRAYKTVSGKSYYAGWKTYSKAVKTK